MIAEAPSSAHIAQEQARIHREQQARAAEVATLKQGVTDLERKQAALRVEQQLEGLDHAQPLADVGAELERVRALIAAAEVADRELAPMLVELASRERDARIAENLAERGRLAAEHDRRATKLRATMLQAAALQQECRELARQEDVLRDSDLLKEHRKSAAPAPLRRSAWLGPTLAGATAEGFAQVENGGPVPWGVR